MGAAKSKKGRIIALKVAVRHSLSCPKEVSAKARRMLTRELAFLTAAIALEEKQSVGSKVTPSSFG